MGEGIQERLDEQARIIFGLVEGEKLKNNIRIVLIGG
ncbi:hypothetical protein CO174_04335 [Candidatus Uhrbacteria bacterium CG_4_9_14_3_um_filter_50_9]|uniref:Uncharacterized protein n=1 Tax=Candidatus Uhrbacteria bacterium CG_4_9_14_3_um_filter_50_9 TaxID=1975035 RepID=A0A2M7XBM0_9BACT|nr:MAG: hypothetical protein CO174_04335 [Candidatus Uhrbacteria bacterium CG_4_9_14_3_um_filter_50_9]